MKKEDLLGILQNNDLDENAKIEKIQALNGIDRQSEITKKQNEIDTLKAEFETERNSWNTERESFKGMISKDDHQKVLDELNTYKSNEEKVRRNNYLKSIGANDKYVDLISQQIDWSEATFENDTYKGEKFEGQIKNIKTNYSDLFVVENKNLASKGYYGNNNTDTTDLTKL